MFPPFERDELINLRQRAESLAEHVVPSWSRAYHALANAVDHLDAMIARTIVRVDPSSPSDREPPWWDERGNAKPGVKEGHLLSADELDDVVAHARRLSESTTRG